MGGTQEVGWHSRNGVALKKWGGTQEPTGNDSFLAGNHSFKFQGTRRTWGLPWYLFCSRVGFLGITCP